MKELYICKCGRMHIVKINEETYKSEKETALICRNCGAVRVFGAEKTWDEYSEKDAYNLYQYDFAEYEDTVEVTEMRLARALPLDKFILSQGIKVPMMNGKYANTFSYGAFEDTSYPDEYRIRAKITERYGYKSTASLGEKFMAVYRACREEAHEVNMDRLIRENKKEDLDFISNFCIEGLDWSGTEFSEKPWNKKENV